MFSQDISSLEDLLGYAYVHHPEFKNRELEKDKLNASVKSIGALSPTIISYQGGQINDSPFDNQVNIYQDISGLFFTKIQRSIVDTQITLTDNTTSIKKLEFKLIISDLYNSYLYYLQLQKEYQAWCKETQFIIEKLQLQYKLGEIDLVTLGLAKNYDLKINTQSRKNEVSLNDIEFQLRKAVFLPDSIKLPREEFKQMPYLSDPLLDYQSLKNQDWNLMREMLDKQKSLQQKQEKLPNFTVGAFSQSIEKKWLFAGINVGVAIPIDKRQQKFMLEKINIDQKINDNIQNQWIEGYKLSMKNREERLNVYQEIIDSYGKGFLQDKKKQLERIRMQLLYGEINFLDYSQLFETIQQLQLDYWDAIWEWNNLNTML